MAQMLQDKFSSEKHIDVSERHARLCNRTLSAASLALDIQPFITALQASKDAVKLKEKERSYAYDSVVFFNGSLDNGVQD